MHLRIAGATLMLLVIAGCSSSAKSTAPPAASTSPPAASTSPPAASTSPTSATAPQAIDPCELVSQAQARSLAGTEMLPGLAVRTDRSTDSTCTYTPPPDGPEAQVEVLLGSAAEREGARETAGAIYFRRDDVWVGIRVTSGVDPAVLRARLRALAREISGRA